MSAGKRISLREGRQIALRVPTDIEARRAEYARQEAKQDEEQTVATPNDGGPALRPCVYCDQGVDTSEPWMNLGGDLQAHVECYRKSLPPMFNEECSLRDWFAGQALGHIPRILEACEVNPSMAQIAEHAYMVADAMLAEREKGEEHG